MIFRGRLFLFSVFAFSFFITRSNLQAIEIDAVLAGSRMTFWNVLQRGIDQAAIDFNMTTLTRSPSDEHQENIKKNIQLSMINYMIKNGAQGLILAPIKVHDIKTPIKLPIPVIFVDRDSTEYQAESVISTDNLAAGKIAAQTLKGYVKKGCKVGIFRLAETVISTTQREQAFIEEVRKRFKCEIAIDRYLGHGMRDAFLEAKTLFGEYKGPTLDVVFTPNEQTTYGAMMAIRELKEKPLHIGFDYRPEFIDAIRDKSIHALIVQDPYLMGYRAMQEFNNYMRGGKIPKKINIDVLVFNKDNIDDSKYRKMIHQYGQN